MPSNQYDDPYDSYSPNSDALTNLLERAFGYLKSVQAPSSSFDSLLARVMSAPKDTLDSHYAHQEQRDDRQAWREERVDQYSDEENARRARLAMDDVVRLLSGLSSQPVDNVAPVQAPASCRADQAGFYHADLEDPFEYAAPASAEGGRGGRGDVPTSANTSDTGDYMSASIRLDLHGGVHEAGDAFEHLRHVLDGPGGTLDYIRSAFPGVSVSFEVQYTK